MVWWSGWGAELGRGPRVLTWVDDGQMVLNSLLPLSVSLGLLWSFPLVLETSFLSWKCLCPHLGSVTTLNECICLFIFLFLLSGYIIHSLGTWRNSSLMSLWSRSKYLSGVHVFHAFGLFQNWVIKPWCLHACVYVCMYLHICMYAGGRLFLGWWWETEAAYVSWSVTCTSTFVLRPVLQGRDYHYHHCMYAETEA